MLHRALDLTMIYVTHDQTEALTFADTVVVMYEGSVVQIGTPEELFAAARSHLRRLLHRLAGHERAAGGGRGTSRRGSPADDARPRAELRRAAAGARIEARHPPRIR